MSLDTSTYLVVGAPVSALITSKKIETEVTKYNPDTGIPYVRKNVIYEYRLGKFKLADKSIAALEAVVHLMDGLAYFSSSEDSIEDTFLGVTVEELDCSGRIKIGFTDPTYIERLISVHTTVKQLFRKYDIPTIDIGVSAITTASF